MQRVARWDALVLAAHLVRVRSPHAGQFLPRTNHSNAIQAKIDGFLQHSSFAARAIKDGSLRMVIVHDVANLSLTSWANVSLVHYQQRHQSIAPNDARWEAFGALAMFERFLAALQQRTRDHYHLLEKKTGRAPQFVIDMLVCTCMYLVRAE
ncbi:hypothetical protein AB1Y20_011773 [Prymnesium parvum]|uniref:Uncharacterized protein n=1 Tax=Prymnesium parvum TaxID=97485 RepID=A0AB34IJZ6_PRYPA